MTVLNHRFEKSLAILVVLTLIAIFIAPWLLTTKLVIRPDHGIYEQIIYSDTDKSNGSSSVKWIDESQWEWECELRDKYQYPYCGFQLFLNRGFDDGIDLSHFDRVRFSLEYQGQADTIRVFLRNNNPRYTIPNDERTTKFNQLEIHHALIDFPATIEFSAFSVSDWWIRDYGIPVEQSYTEFDNIVTVEIHTGNGAPHGTHRYSLQEIQFSGKILDTEYWYLLIIVFWLCFILIYLGYRIFSLNWQLRNHQKRQEELLEVNQLLDDHRRTLEYKSKTDPLTGALNREGAQGCLSDGLLGWREEKRPLSVILIDLDYFKAINDNHGHDAGDHVLIQFAEVIRANIREQQMFARWGGEEFLLVCHDTAMDDAIEIADRLRECALNHTFFNSIKVTASFGVTSLRATESIAKLFRRADTALYDAKARGRNCVAWR